MNQHYHTLRTLASLLMLAGLFVVSAKAQSPCVNGLSAGLYPCENVDLLGTLGVNQVGGGEMNDIWGWTDPLNGKEYVLLGRTNGTASSTFPTPPTPCTWAT